MQSHSEHFSPATWLWPHFSHLVSIRMVAEIMVGNPTPREYSTLHFSPYILYKSIIRSFSSGVHLSSGNIGFRTKNSFFAVHLVVIFNDLGRVTLRRSKRWSRILPTATRRSYALDVHPSSPNDEKFLHNRPRKPIVTRATIFCRRTC